MYQQINPTEIFRERQIALLEEADNRRLARRLRAAREPKLGSRRAAALGFLAAVVVASLMLLASSREAQASTTFSVSSTGDTQDANLDDGICGDVSGHCTLRAAIQ